MMGLATTPTESIAAILADPEKFAAKKAELERIKQEGQEAHNAVRAERAQIEKERQDFEYAKRKAADDAIATSEKNAAERAANEAWSRALKANHDDLAGAVSRHEAQVSHHTEHWQEVEKELSRRSDEVQKRERAIADLEKAMAEKSAALESRIANARDLAAKLMG